MAKNSRDGNRERAARHRAALTARGLEQFQVIAPSEAKPLIRQAAGLMTRETDPVEPRAALRQVGGANEPEPDGAAADLAAELEAARARIAAADAQRIEIEAEAERQRRALEAERDAARAAEVEAERQRQATIIEARKVDKAAQEALRRAQKAEATMRQLRSLPTLRGRLVRWLAGDVLK